MTATHSLNPPDPFRAYLLRFLSSAATEDILPFDFPDEYDSSYDVTAQGILEGLGILFDRVRRGEAKTQTNQIEDASYNAHALPPPLPPMPQCPTCEGSSTRTPWVIPLPPEFTPTFSSPHEEVKFPCAQFEALSALRNQAEEIQWLNYQVSDVARVCSAVACGDLSQRVTVPVQGTLMVQLKDVVNTMAENLDQVAKEIVRVSLEIGAEGTLFEQAVVPTVQGTWKDVIENVNLMAMNRIELDTRGEMLDLKLILNDMTRSLSLFADEVTRVAREVGTEGRFGGQVRVVNARGTWEVVVDSINYMFKNLTLQMQTIGVAINAVARGDCTQKIKGSPVSGEMSHIFNDINYIIDQLAIFMASDKKKAS
ncbi:hypothetical protein H0H81_012766 [Sphagnurus paluster]|uniref:HAMP domain-containing protein n=1 Tax=Sphagnurus paluster TaxID=117069 RepID=A0A9P7KFG8_9AGAR|nr:hypothetical protein H0H81_012766 [Sphagnurus paluster]